LPVEEQAAMRHDIQIKVENCSTLSTLKVFEMWYVNFVNTYTLFQVKKFCSPEYQGKYFCVVESTDPETAKIYTKELDVSIEMCQPTITEQPANQCRIETQPIVLTCKAIGYPSVEYQWYHNNKKIFDQLDSTLTVVTTNCCNEYNSTYRDI